jgi:putative membrane protein
MIGARPLFPRILASGLAAAALVGAVAAWAQDVISAQDFVSRTAVAAMFGVESATLALHKSNTPAIKDFAHSLADENAATTSGLRRIIAKRSDIALPDRPDGKHLALLRDLADKQGNEFDSAYVEAQRGTHREAAALMEHYAQRGEDPELKRFAEQSLPTFRALDQKARELPNGP